MTPEQFHATIRANIRRVRQAKGMTPSQLSEAIGKSSTYIAKVEIGHWKPTRTTVEAIAEVLGVGIEELLT